MQIIQNFYIQIDQNMQVRSKWDIIYVVSDNDLCSDCWIVHSRDFKLTLHHHHPQIFLAPVPSAVVREAVKMEEELWIVGADPAPRGETLNYSPFTSPWSSQECQMNTKCPVQISWTLHTVQSCEVSWCLWYNMCDCQNHTGSHLIK